MSGIGSCKRCGYEAGILSLKNGLCKQCRDKEKDGDTRSSNKRGSDASFDTIENCTLTTKLLMSAAHLFPRDFENDITERLEHPYKASAPEFGIDLRKIRNELEAAKGKLFVKSLFLFFVSVIAFLIFFQNPENNVSILFLALLLATIAELLYLKSAKKKIRNIMYAQDSDNRHEDLLNRLSEKKNVIISGGYSPFIGAGFPIDSWSFAVDLSEPEDKQLTVGNVTADELHKNIVQKLRKLNIDDMTISDELFVNGQDVTCLSQLLPNGRMKRPVDWVGQPTILNKINSNDRRERHYRVIRIPMWDGQLLLSMYYRFLVLNDNLFCEARFFILTPLKKKYLDMNSIPPEPIRREFFSNLEQSLLKGAFSWIAVIFRALVFVSGGFMADLTRRKTWRKEIESNRLYNYGWEKSLREKWASSSYERYFQQVDKDVSLKMLTNEFLASLLDYLSEKNISIEQFKQTQTKIINEGVMISGGEIKADTLVVGKGVQVAKTAINAVKGGGKSL